LEIALHPITKRISFTDINYFSSGVFIEVNTRFLGYIYNFLSKVLH